MRDDFSHKIRRILADRAGHKCSVCGKATSGPSTDPEGALSDGEAAHITAASRGGPRFDPTLSREKRRSAENGIWACTQHSREIDADSSGYSSQHCRALRDAVKKQPQRSLARRPQPRTNQPVSLSFHTQTTPTNSLKLFRLNPTRMPRRWSFASNYGEPDNPHVCSTLRHESWWRRGIRIQKSRAFCPPGLATIAMYGSLRRL